MATGENAFLKESVTPGRALIVSVDESAHSTKAKLIKRGFRKSDTQNVQVMTSFDVRQMKALEESLKAFRPTLVIIDSLKRINQGHEISENSAEFADNIYTIKEMLTRYGAAGILIHHTNKNQEAMGVNKLRGSSAIAGAVWGTWQLDHIPKADSSNKKKLIIDPKDPKRVLSVFARNTEGQELQIELDPENNSWINLGGVGDSEEWEQERKTLQERIIHVLTRNAHLPGLSGKQIIELMGMTREEGGSIYGTLNRMVNKRLITCRSAPGDKRYNVYSLPNQTPAPVKDSTDVWDCVRGVWVPQEGSTGSSESPPPSTPSLPPPVSDLNVDYEAETHTQHSFPIVNKILNNYSTNSQHTGVVNTPVDYSKLDSASVPEIVNNFESKRGKECVNGNDGSADIPGVVTIPPTPSTPLTVGERVRINNPGSKYHGKLATIARLKTEGTLQLADLEVDGEKRRIEVQVTWLERVEGESQSEDGGFSK